MLNEEKSSHRPERLKGYDYTASGFYFVTFNTKVRQENILCSIVGPAPLGGPAISQPAPVIQFTQAGEIVRRLIENIDKSYDNAHVDCYVIMPDHVHLLIYLGPFDHICKLAGSPENPGPFSRTCKFAGPPRGAGPTNRPASSAKPTSLPKIINAIRAMTTKQLGCSIWQARYYDHIIRNEADLQSTREYIRNNPLNWVLNQP